MKRSLEDEILSAYPCCGQYGKVEQLGIVPKSYQKLARVTYRCGRIITVHWWQTHKVTVWLEEDMKCPNKIDYQCRVSIPGGCTVWMSLDKEGRLWEECRKHIRTHTPFSVEFRVKEADATD